MRNPKLSVWYLPLSEEIASDLGSGTPLDAVQLCRYEVAAILFLLQLPKLVEKAKSSLELERFFAQLLTYPTDQLESVLAESYSLTAFASGVQITATWGIALLDQDSVTKRQYVHADGSWNFNFATSLERPSRVMKYNHVLPSGRIMRLSDPQHRLIETIRANPGDSVETQGYAGSGKTILTIEILSILSSSRCLFLADVESKLWPIKKQFSQQKIKTHTFFELAIHILSRGNSLLTTKIKAAAARKFSAQRVAEKMNISSMGNLEGHRIVFSIIRPAINKFCISTDRSIGIKHMPASMLTPFSQAQQQLLVALANQLWSMIIDIDIDHQDIDYPVYGWHRLKQIALMGLHIPTSFQVVIIDEGHDLIAPLIEILDRSPQVVITLGDQLQNLQGQPASHAASIRHREMTLSLRAGRQISDYLNPLISTYPDARVEPFIGNIERETVIAEYRPEQFPPEPCVIIVADEWGVFDWLIRNRYEGKGAAVVNNAPLGTFLDDCLNLYTGNTHKTTIKHSKLAGYNSWDDLRKDMLWNDAFLRVESWLEKVGIRSNVNGLYNVATVYELGTGTPNRHLIVTVAAAKNFELPKIAISEDIYYFDDLRGKREMSKKISLIYTAITRCSGKIFFPSTHDEWINCIIQSRK